MSVFMPQRVGTGAPRSCEALRPFLTAILPKSTGRKPVPRDYLHPRDENIESLAFCGVEKVAVPEGRPTSLVGGHHLVLCEKFPQRHRRALIKKNSQLRGGQGASRRMLKDRPNLVQRHARKPLNKPGHLRSVLKILEKRCDRHTAVAKHPRPAENSRVALDSRAGRPINHFSRIHPV